LILVTVQLTYRKVRDVLGELQEHSVCLSFVTKDCTNCRSS